MSYPKRKKGWRTITVNQRKFIWRLGIGVKNTNVVLRGPLSSCRQVIIRLHGWYDIWNWPIGHFDKFPNNPPVITPKFAAQAIDFALKNGWQPNQSGVPIYLDYENNTCILSQIVDKSRREILIDTTTQAKARFPVFLRMVEFDRE